MSFFGNATTTPQTGGGLFGASTQQQQQPAGGGLFGAPAQNAATSNAPATSAFGNTGGLFGQNANTNPGTQGAPAGGAFGQPQQQPAAGGGGLFGNAQAQPAQAGGLFGAPTQPTQPAAGGGLFGSSTTQPATGGGLFGAAGASQPAAPGGGLFGSTTTQPAATTGGGLFGASTTQPATGGGLFGASTTQPAATTGGGLFGAPAAQPAATGGGLFGASTAQPAAAGGGLFGASTTQPQQAGGSLFGASTTQPQQAGGSLFGGGGGGGMFGANKPTLALNTTGAAQTTTNPLFGQSQAKPSLFGQSTAPAPAPTTTNPFFGAGNTSTLGTSALGGGFSQPVGALGTSILGRSVALSQPQDPQSQHLLLQQRIEGVYNAWNSASPHCRFQHAFYNFVDPTKVAQYQRPQNISNELWEKARRENPDPSCFVPVFATGFDDLRLRVDAQSAQSEKLKQRLTDVKKRLDVLSERHALSNVSRLKRATAQQVQLTQRLLAFTQHLHLLIPAIRSSAIRPEEEQLRGRLEEIEEELRRGRLAGKLNELWALIGAVGATSEKGRNGDGSTGEWAVVDEEGLAQIAQILKEQQAGLGHLTTVLLKMQKDLAFILLRPGSGEDGSVNSHSEPWGTTSTSTLRASALR